MIHQPKPSYGGDSTYSRGAAETAADFAKVGRGQRWGSFPANLPRRLQPWPEEGIRLKQTAPNEKDEGTKDDES